MAKVEEDPQAMSPAVRLRSLGALLIAFLAVCAIADSASAANKPYSVVVAPSPVAARPQLEFTATFTNRTKAQQLGSADLTAPTAPASFTLVSASVAGTGTATLSGNVVQLRNLALPPGASVAVKVTADVPCTLGDYDWSVTAKQSNDFSGLPGNNLGPLVDSSLTTSVTDCATVVPCRGAADCEANLSNANTTFDVTARSSSPLDGRLIVNRNVGAPLDCAGYTERSAGDFAVDFLPDMGLMGREKLATLTIDKVPASRVPLLNVCFGAPFPFTNKAGQTAPFDESLQLFVGLLPDCGDPPCVSKRDAQAGQGIIQALAPGGDQDPRFGG